MAEQQRLQFTRLRDGYAPQEVDAVTLELQRQIADLRQQNGSLNSLLAQYDGKVRQLAENTNRLQEERARESQRISAFLSQTSRTKQDILVEANMVTENARNEAAKITDEARREAEGIIETARLQAGQRCREAQAALEAAQAALCGIDESTQALWQHNEDYAAETAARLEEISACIAGALDGAAAEPAAEQPQAYTAAEAPTAEWQNQIPAPQAPVYTAAETPPIEQTTYDAPAAAQMPPVTAEAPQTAPAPEADPYDEFVRKMVTAGNRPAYQPSAPRGGFHIG